MIKRILHKYEGNPIIKPSMLPEQALYTFNPGAIKFKDEYILMMDVTTLDDIHRIWIARSRDGYHFEPDPLPVEWPEPDPDHKETCTYDPRITRIGDEYFILYASDLSQNDVRIGILKTTDFRSFQRVSTASELGNRNGALFPEIRNGLYMRLDRPFGNEMSPCYMWISYSPDLVYWGRSKPLTYQGRPFRDGYKMGAGAVPIKTEEGWLEIYHTVSQTCNGFIYRLKACLLDLEEPSKVLGYTRDFLLWPEHDYEMYGRVMNVVFTCNALLENDGTVKIYYGAADTHIGLAEGKLNEIIQACRNG
ncbi:MAG: glycosylase [Paenibacillaceae bacterium]|nr:glycosylase [Paenibacillaceae bacterium]